MRTPLFFPPAALALMALASVALAAGGARAGTTDDEKRKHDEDVKNVIAAAEPSASDGTDATDAADVPASVATPSTPSSPSATPVATAGIASVTPEAKVEGKADKKNENKFPLSGSISLDNSFGESFLSAPSSQSGTDIPIEGGPPAHFDPVSGNHNNWSTSLSLSGRASLPKADYLPKMGLSTGVAFNIANWLPAIDNGTVFERQVQVSDISVGLSMPSLLTEDYTKISMSPSFGARIPISLHSRQQNLITALRAGANFAWSGPEQSWGTIGASYGAGLGFNIYSAPYASIPGTGNQTVGNGVAANPLASGSLPIAYCRSTEQLSATGECALSGRQGIASFSNNLGVNWGLGNHSVSVGLGWSLGFKRSLSNRPDLASEFASGQNFDEGTTGSISYGYDVPVDFAKVSLSAGISSGQPAFDDSGNLRFPFFNFFTPNTNMSSASVGVSVGL